MSRGAATDATGGALVRDRTLEPVIEKVAREAFEVACDGEAAAPGLLRDFAMLSKLRVNLLVLATAAVGYALAQPAGVPIDALRLAHVLAGVFLLAASASALNQVREQSRDRLMERTASRPLAAGRRSARAVALVAVPSAIAGTAYLGLSAGLLPACLGLLTVVLYIGAYTPLKPRSPLALHVGAIAGALPPVIGWTAASERAAAGAWILFAILFLWQIPHFHAIAWLYRDDYRRGGFRLLAVVRPDGRLVAIEAVACALLLAIVSFLPVFTGLSMANAYGAIAATLGTLFLGAAIVFGRDRTERNARALMIASLAYLPLILLAWVLAIG